MFDLESAGRLRVVCFEGSFKLLDLEETDLGSAGRPRSRRAITTLVVEDTVEVVKLEKIAASASRSKKAWSRAVSTSYWPPSDPR